MFEIKIFYPRLARLVSSLFVLMLWLDWYLYSQWLNSPIFWFIIKNPHSKNQLTWFIFAVLSFVYVMVFLYRLYVFFNDIIQIDSLKFRSNNKEFDIAQIKKLTFNSKSSKSKLLICSQKTEISLPMDRYSWSTIKKIIFFLKSNWSWIEALSNIKSPEKAIFKSEYIILLRIIFIDIIFFLLLLLISFKISFYIFWNPKVAKETIINNLSLTGKYITLNKKLNMPINKNSSLTWSEKALSVDSNINAIDEKIKPQEKKIVVNEFIKLSEWSDPDLKLVSPNWQEYLRVNNDMKILWLSRWNPDGKVSIFLYKNSRWDKKPYKIILDKEKPLWKDFHIWKIPWDIEKGTDYFLEVCLWLKCIKKVRSKFYFTIWS